MKRMLLQMSARMRFVMAMFAMLGAMWAAIDLHPHEEGLHQSGQCVVCSLEDSIAHGFSLHAATQPVVPLAAFATVVWQKKHTTSACARSVSIRAPPLS